MLRPKILIVLAGFFITAVLFIKCSDDRAGSQDPRGPYYAGSASCIKCHGDINASYIHSTHRNTSALIGNTDIASYLATTDTIVTYADSATVSVRKKGNDYFQVHRQNGQELNSQEFALAIGSGDRAQSYGYWKAGQLMQFPLTYLSEKKQWVNSPGFNAKSPYYNRPILSRCLECHASYADKTNEPGAPMEVIEKIRPSSVIYGIDCERCHGPSIDHVRFHNQFPDEKKAKYVTSIASLTRQQKVDLCASCHSGNDQDMQREIFTFKPGDPLSAYVMPSMSPARKEQDVHGKQTQLMMASACYKSSGMTCQSCHNSHPAKKDTGEYFISKCMDCHKNSQHAVALSNNATACLNCHMPAQASKAITFTAEAGRSDILYMLRSHRIAIYPDSATGHAERVVQKR